MKNLILLFMFFIFLNSSSAQTENENNKGEWIVTNQFGIATLEAEKLFKTTVTVFEGTIGREFYLNKKTSLITGLELLRIRGGFYDGSNQIFLNNNSINIPLNLRFYLSNSLPLQLYGDIGLYGSYLYQSNMQNILLDTSVDDNGFGYNFGTQLGLGLKYKLVKKLSINLGFKYKTDFASSYPNSKQQFELSEFYTIQMGLGFNF